MIPYPVLVDGELRQYDEHGGLLTAYRRDILVRGQGGRVLRRIPIAGCSWCSAVYPAVCTACSDRADRLRRSAECRGQLWLFGLDEQEAGS